MHREQHDVGSCGTHVGDSRPHRGDDVGDDEAIFQVVAVPDIGARRRCAR